MDASAGAEAPTFGGDASLGDGAPFGSIIGNDGGCFACPATVPEAGTPCSDPMGFGSCEYGDDPQSSCNAYASCIAGAWSVSAPQTTVGCPTTLPPSCPATFDAALLAGADAGAFCASAFECRYPGGGCQCTPATISVDRSILTYVWSCSTPTPGCPAVRPRFGTRCGDAGTCEYGGPCGNQPAGESAQCNRCGSWQPVYCAIPE
jgi:hypothetical protein